MSSHKAPAVDVTVRHREVIVQRVVTPTALAPHKSNFPPQSNVGGIEAHKNNKSCAGPAEPGSILAAISEKSEKRSLEFPPRAAPRDPAVYKLDLNHNYLAQDAPGPMTVHRLPGQRRWQTADAEQSSTRMTMTCESRDSM